MSRRPLLALLLGLSLAATADAAPEVKHHAPPHPPKSTVEQHQRPSERFAWPVTPHKVLRRYQPPEKRWGPGHRGVDLGTSTDAVVFAPADGIVTFSGVIAGRGVLSIKHPQGFSTTYEPVSERIAKGTAVHRGQRIAQLDAGHCPGQTCLHWGYRIGKDEYRNPLTLVGGQRPILLPPQD